MPNVSRALFVFAWFAQCSLGVFYCRIWCIMLLYTQRINTYHKLFCSALLIYIFSFQTNCWSTNTLNLNKIIHIQTGTLYCVTIRSLTCNCLKCRLVPLNCSSVFNIIIPHLLSGLYSPISHFFLAASKFGADTLTLPGMFLDKSVSLTLRNRSFSLVDVSLAFIKLKTAVRAAFPFF